LAYVEIKKAVNNPDPHISNAASIALGKFYQYPLDEKKVSQILEPYKSYEILRGNNRVLNAYARELAIYVSELHGSKWTAMLRVIDDDGKPLSGAAVSVSYATPPEPDEKESDDTWKIIKEDTSVNGEFTASHSDSSGVLGFNVKKEGYYNSRGSYKFAFSGQFDSQRMTSNRSPVVTVLLKKIIHPVPMYVNRVDIAHREKPDTDKPVGFDLTIGDFVAPYGKGTNAQIFFTWHVEYVDTNSAQSDWKRSRKGWDGRMTISFPNSGDGTFRQ